MQPGTIRALKILVVVMGVAIILGTATLGVLIVKRLRGGEATPTAAVTAPVAAPPVAAPVAASGSSAMPGETLLRQLDEPSGTTIATIALSIDRLAIQLRGGGPDRVILLDARTGAAIARVTLAR